MERLHNFHLFPISILSFFYAQEFESDDILHMLLAREEYLVNQIRYEK